MNAGAWRGRRVFLTGHTGFKGGWLALLLAEMGAEVHGYALEAPTEPSFFAEARVRGCLASHAVADVRDAARLRDAMAAARPEAVFHLAAQPLVRRSYREPAETFETNVMGTVNLLQACAAVPGIRAVVNVTSDKCYENQEWTWGYRENDRLGGKDPYSASKAAAEIAISAMHHSFFKSASRVSIASARAGNVIGGGDWAPNRIVPDAMRSWAEKNPVKIRNPHSTRPWQHVLEPLSGYLRLGQRLRETGGQKLNGESFNFGPSASQNLSVLGLLEKLALVWREQVLPEFVQFEPQDSFHEAGLLKLNCDKAQHLLDWFPTLDIDQTIEFTGEWYVEFNKATSVDMIEYTNMQINEFQKRAIGRGFQWAE